MSTDQARTLEPTLRQAQGERSRPGRELQPTLRQAQGERSRPGAERRRWSARRQPTLRQAQGERWRYAIAAALTVAALALPLWGFAMSAPQYPDETLHLQIVRTGIVGDVHEVETLQQYIGVRFPTTLPELQWATRAMAAIAALLVAGALVGGGTFGRVFRAACAVAMIAFLIGSAAAVQMRLYRVGHERDRNAPIRAVHDFTPPFVGPVKVGNFTVWSFPHVGAALLLVAAGFAVSGVRTKAA